MGTFLRHCFQNQNGTWDLSRILLAIMAVSYVAQSAYAISYGHTAFNWEGFGVGAGALIGGGGAGVMFHGKNMT